jgi:DNA-binding response OmpR family regulator
LNSGADDYLEKPFQIEEIIARLRALTRRAAGKASALLRHDGIELDAVSGVVTKSGRPIELTAKELRILNYLMHRPKKNESRQSNIVEVYVARLRKKLGHDVIRTIRGLGYRLGPSEHAAK